MSFKKNVIANYASQIYVTVIGILILPLYIKYMGSESFGLVGFFTMLQAWFALLDMGLTPTIARETARYHGGSMTALHYRQLFRALSIIFVSIAVIGGGILWLFADSISHKWLKVNELHMDTVVVAVQIMAASVALRWLGGLYRGVITGSERLVWLSAFNAVITTMRFPAVFITLWVYGFTIVVFFWHQLAVALLEVVGLYMMSNKLKPTLQSREVIGWSFESVRPVLKFALTIALTSSLWVLLTQVDKLVLSGVLSLDQYGYFVLAVLVAGAISALNAPIGMVLMPRMARLYAEKKIEELYELYRGATQLVNVLSGSASLVIAFNAETLIYVWTGDKNLALNSAPILSLYSLGNGLLGMVAFPYYLQYALGNLRYHLIGNIVLGSVLVPTIVISATMYGGVGAGWAWLNVNALYLLLWIGYIHGRISPGLHWGWIGKDFLFVLAPVVFILIGFKFFGVENMGRVNSFLYLIMLAFLSLVLASLGSSFLRDKFLLFIKKR